MNPLAHFASLGLTSLQIQVTLGSVSDRLIAGCMPMAGFNPR